jgi:hypothetical protein
MKAYTRLFIIFVCLSASALAREIADQVDGRWKCEKDFGLEAKPVIIEFKDRGTRVSIIGEGFSNPDGSGCSGTASFVPYTGDPERCPSPYCLGYDLHINDSLCAIDILTTLLLFHPRELAFLSLRCEKL